MDLDSISENEVKSPIFRNLKNHPEWWSQLKQLYNKTKDYLDSNFWKKDPIYLSDKNFKSKLWEMIVIKYFLDKGAEIVKKDKEVGPDIKIKLENNQYLFIECVLATKGNNPNDKFYDGQGYSGSVEEYNRSKIIRIIQATSEKYEKYQSWAKKGIIQSNDLYIVAINSDFGEVDSFELDNLERVLYGKGDMVQELDLKNKTKRTYFNQKLKVQKINLVGSKIDLNNGIFLNPKYNNLTGVLYSGYPNINSIGRKCFSVGFNKDLALSKKYLKKYFCGYSFLAGTSLKRKIHCNNNVL